jgi:3-deoxy-D-manno-octulosonate 8-phosphate phosphatase (KDO 8-P phosphatase)
VRRCQSIELLVLDVDGVLTDGAIVLNDQGVETKHFHVRDGAAIALWRQAGKRVAILSGRRATVVDLRAAELGISPVIQGASHKLPAFHQILADLGLEPAATAFMGDDLADLPPMATTGLAACPADAAPEVRQAAHFVAPSPGGRGAVRELVELLLKSQQRWTPLLAALTNPEKLTC